MAGGLPQGAQSGYRDGGWRSPDEITELEGGGIPIRAGPPRDGLDARHLKPGLYLPEIDVHGWAGRRQAPGGSSKMWHGDFIKISAFFFENISLFVSTFVTVLSKAGPRAGRPLC